MRAGILPRAVQAESKAILRPKAHITEIAISEDTQGIAEGESKRELLIALAAVLITLASALPIVMLRPVVAEWMRYGDNSLQHPRAFVATGNGGTIRYSAPPRSGTTQWDPAKLSAQYRADLALLERRFRRGHFQMTEMSGGDSIPEIVALRRHAADLSYNLQTQQDGASLAITGRTPGARAAVAAYMRLLGERWTVGR